MGMAANRLGVGGHSSGRWEEARSILDDGYNAKRPPIGVGGWDSRGHFSSNCV